MLRHPDTASRYLLRHPGNTNLHLYHQPTYRGLPLMIDKGPFVEEYLSRLVRAIQRALTQYPRVMAFRVDLTLPRDIEWRDYADSNEVISRFINSFSAKIEHHRSQLREQKQDARDCKVRYAWAREVGMSSGRPHYHLVFLLNHDAYHRPGKLKSRRRNLVTRLKEAWASALQLSVDKVGGVVHITDDATYRIYRDPEGRMDELPALFERASYLCKAATKPYGGRLRWFDTSKG